MGYHQQSDPKFHRCDNVRCNPAHQMHLDPITFAHQSLVPIFGINPLIEAASRKARGIHSKVRFNRLQRQAAFLDQGLKQGCQSRILKVAGNRVVVRRFRQMAFVLSISQVRHKATTRNAGVNLKRAGENDVTKRQPGSAHFLFWFFYTLAQLSKQLDKLFLFARLRFVVAGPGLTVGFLYNKSFGEGLSLTVIRVFALNGKRDREQVLAGLLSRFKVWTGALLGVGINNIFALPACEGTSQSSPSRVSRDRAAISRPLISLASMTCFPLLG
jgi:hypothetical protein